MKNYLTNVYLGIYVFTSISIVVLVYYVCTLCVHTRYIHKILLMAWVLQINQVSNTKGVFSVTSLSSRLYDCVLMHMPNALPTPFLGVTLTSQRADRKVNNVLVCSSSINNTAYVYVHCLQKNVSVFCILLELMWEAQGRTRVHLSRRC